MNDKTKVKQIKEKRINRRQALKRIGSIVGTTVLGGFSINSATAYDYYNYSNYYDYYNYSNYYDYYNYSNYYDYYNYSNYSD
jgi:hypothetical protein